MGGDHMFLFLNTEWVTAMWQEEESVELGARQTLHQDLVLTFLTGLGQAPESLWTSVPAFLPPWLHYGPHLQLQD